MAQFEIADAFTRKNEGGYANNPSDRGGETYAGIARKFWGGLEIWKYVDAAKAKIGYDAKTKVTPVIQKKLNAILDTPEVKSLKKLFYKKNFWNINSLDLIHDQQIADTIYDFSVNSGEDRAAKFAQLTANDLGSKLTVDGDIGAKSISAINGLDPKIFHDLYNSKRREFYNSIAKGNQAQFLRSWVVRLKPYTLSK